MPALTLFLVIVILTAFAVFTTITLTSHTIAQGVSAFAFAVRNIVFHDLRTCCPGKLAEYYTSARNQITVSSEKLVSLARRF